MPGAGPEAELLAQLRPYVRHCGHSRRPAWRLGRRRLLDYLLVHIEAGRGRFTIAGTTYDAEPGDLFWIPPDTEHEMEGFPPAMVCPYVHFDLLYRPEVSHWDFSIPGGLTDLGELRPLLHPPLPEPRLDALCGRLRTPANARIGALLAEVCTEAARGQPFAQLRMSGLMLEIVAELLRTQAGLPAGGGGEHIPLLEKAADWLEQHGDAADAVTRAAALCRLSPSYFRRLFARHFGCPPRDFRKRGRIRLAKQLMIGGNLDLSEIAQRAGFATVHSFSRAFRAVEGLPPGQYRRFGRIMTRVEGRQTPYSH
jgi:AraC-like DNA-binding protein